jgi:hypothetical protein
MLTPDRSSFYPAHYGYAPGQVKTACQVLRSFYNYLMNHNVCDEYREDLLAARKVCDQAEFELAKVYTAGLVLPGPFNLAASTIFGGTQAGTYTGNMTWARDMDMEESGMRDDQARVTFMTGVAILGTDAQYDLISAQHDISNIKVINDESVNLEIVSIQLPTQETQELYAQQNRIHQAKITLHPLGKLICKACNINNFAEYDLPKSKYAHGKPFEVEEGKPYEFWIEDNVLSELFEGMKMDARVRTLEGGVTLLDEVKEAMCSFYKWLPNEMWMERHPREFKRLRKGLADVEPEEQVEDNDEQREGSEIDVGDDE